MSKIGGWSTPSGDRFVTGHEFTGADKPFTFLSSRADFSPRGICFSDSATEATSHSTPQRPNPYSLLPDPHPLLRRQIQRLSRLHIERRVPRIDVSHRISTILRRRVRIHHHLLALRGFAHLRRIILAEGDEELLLAGEAVLLRSLLAPPATPCSRRRTRQCPQRRRCSPPASACRSHADPGTGNTCRTAPPASLSPPQSAPDQTASTSCAPCPSSRRRCPRCRRCG